MVITALDVFLILGLQKLGFRFVEALVIALLAVIAACFFVQIALADPDWGAVIAALPRPPRSSPIRHALSRARNPRGDGDAAQSLPALRHRADPQA